MAQREPVCGCGLRGAPMRCGCGRRGTSRCTSRPLWSARRGGQRRARTGAWAGRRRRCWRKPDHDAAFLRQDARTSQLRPFAFRPDTIALKFSRETNRRYGDTRVLSPPPLRRLTVVPKQLDGFPSYATQAHVCSYLCTSQLHIYVCR